jgi:hypothetical protein
MRRWFPLFCLLMPTCLFAIACAGSGSKEDPTANVSGTVNLAGKPLSEGEISFVGEVGTIPDILPIKNGSFSGQVKLGKKRVEIMAYKAGKPPPTATDKTEEFKDNYIHPRFNADSTLTAEVTASGVSPNKFDVEAR